MYAWSENQLGRWSGYAWTKEVHGAIDPYLVWADLRAFADLAERPAWIPVLLRLNGSAAAFTELVASSPKLEGLVRIPPLYGKNASPSLRAAKYCTAAITSAAFAQLLEEGGRFKAQVAELQLGLPVSGFCAEPERLRVKAVPPPSPSQKGSVVVGVIDSGFAFAHRRFRERDGLATRIDAFWDQGPGWSAPNLRAAPRRQPPAGRGGARGRFLETVPYGTQLLGNFIDRRLVAAQGAGGVDEDRVYRELGYRGAELRASHGTHVLDLASGYGPEAFKPGTDLPRIACVALPRQTTADTSGLSLCVYALDALRYIVDRADRLVPGAKIVVNLSYGNIAGPHDGSSLLEQAIDELVRLRREQYGAGSLEVVIAAGNNHLSRCHAQFTLRAGHREQRLAWRVLPDDATPSFIEIWLPQRAAPAEVEVQIESPTGEQSGWVQPGTVWELGSGNNALASVIHLATGRRRMILVAVAATAALDQGRAAAPAGRWEVRVRSRGGAPLRIDAWIQRDDNVHGFRRGGRQSYFDDQDYVRLDSDGRPVEEDRQESHVRRAGTLNAIATGSETIVVGGYRGSDGAAAPYSPRGSEAPGSASRVGPNVMSVSERSLTRRGVLGAGTRSGSTVAMNGTSVAAPQVVRWMAEQMAAGRPGTAQALRARAEKDDPDPRRPAAGSGRPGAVRPPAPDVKPKPPPGRGGAGRIRLVPRGEDRPDTVRPFGKR